MFVTNNGRNDSRYRAGDNDRQMFRRTADWTHWWNVTDYMQRGGRRF